jgi:hypothetical protein
MARRLKTIASEVNAGGIYTGLVARIERSSFTPERKLYARISSFGKTRYGNRLVVHVAGHSSWEIIDHDSTETYRSNDEVEAVLAQWRANRIHLYWSWYTRKQVLKGAPWKEG